LKLIHKREKILLLGMGGHSRSCIDVIQSEDRFEIAGFVINDVTDSAIDGDFEILGSDQDLPNLRRRIRHGFVTVGQIQTASTRMTLYYSLQSNLFEVPTIISPRAYVSPNSIVGDGSIVMHGSVINAGAIVGSNCIINSCALIEHDSMIGDHSHISTGALVNGSVQIKEGSFIGSGAIVNNNVVIGKSCVVSSGHRVDADLADGTIYKGLA